MTTTTTALATSTTATAPPAVTFDYSVDTKRSRDLKLVCARIKKATSTVADQIFAIGRDLIEAKVLVNHGKWRDWLAVEFGWSERTAQRFMRVADVLGSGKSDSLSFLEPTTLYVLSEKSADAVRDDIVKRIEGGERLTDEEIVREVKSAKVKPAAPAAAVEPAAAATTSTPSAAPKHGTDAEIAAKALAEMMTRHFGIELEKARDFLRRIPGGEAIISALDEIEPAPAKEAANDEPSAEEVAAALGEVRNTDDRKIIEGKFEVVPESTDEAEPEVVVVAAAAAAPEVEAEPEDDASDGRAEIDNIPALPLAARAS